jgi:DNA-binding NarL/FixJ family response regulator
VRQPVRDIKVVIVDDQEIYRSALSGLLEIVGGYAVVGTAATGEEAVALTARTAVDLVFMDLRLPGIDGLEATAAIRAVEGAPRVVVISTDRDGLTAEAISRSGAMGGLAKADLDPDWLDRLRDRINEAPPPAEPVRSR